jgi:hypothetical protein
MPRSTKALAVLSASSTAARGGPLGPERHTSYPIGLAGWIDCDGMVANFRQKALEKWVSLRSPSASPWRTDTTSLPHGKDLSAPVESPYSAGRRNSCPDRNGKWGRPRQDEIMRFFERACSVFHVVPRASYIVTCLRSRARDHLRLVQIVFSI